MANRISNREIAEQLGISPTALSLIINHKPGVSDATRETVINELKARGLGHLIKEVPKTEAATEAEPKSICFLIYKRTGEILNLHPFFLLLMEEIEKTAAKSGYSVMLSTIDAKHDAAEQLTKITKSNAKGILIFATEMYADDLAPIMDCNLPIVALDNDFTHLQYNTVSINNDMGTYQAISCLVDAGHQHIGYLKCKYRIDSFDERERGYREALHSYGLELEDRFVVPLSFSEDASFIDMKNYLETNPELPDAFVSDDDTIACGAMRALRQHGLEVPKDIAIIGFNDRPSCELATPPLTTINVSRKGFAKTSVELLIKAIDRTENKKNANRSIKIRIGTHLVKRQSV